MNTDMARKGADQRKVFRQLMRAWAYVWRRTVDPRLKGMSLEQAKRFRRRSHGETVGSWNGAE